MTPLKPNTMKWRHGVLTCSLIASAFLAHGQNSVGIGVSNPNKNAVLELISPNNNQGLLIPKLTTSQRTATVFTSALSATENGLMVFDSDEKIFYYWDATAWKAIGTGSELVQGDGVTIVNNTISVVPQDLEVVGSTLTITNNATAVPIDLSDLNIPQDLQLTGSTLTITNNPSATPVNLSAFTGTNTDEQTLTFDGATGNLSITRITGGPQVVNIPIPTSTPPSGTAGGDLTGSYPNPAVANDAINGAKIADGTITSADVLDGSITSADILDNSINSNDINDESIGSVDITNNSINGGDILDESIASADITNGTIVSADIADETILSGDIANGTILGADIADGTVASADITDNTILGADINDGTVASIDIADNTITSADINDATISSADIGAVQVTNAHIATGVAVGKLAPGANGQFLTTAAGSAQWAAAPTATGTAGGDLAGSYPNPQIANLTIVDGDISTTAAINVSKLGAGALSQVLTTTAGGTAWAAAPTATGAAGGDLTGTFPNPQIAGLTIVDGDISNTANINVSKFSVGANGQVLTTSGATALWANPSGSVLLNNTGLRNLHAGLNVGGPLNATVGSDNVFHGFQAGAPASSGSWNVVIGADAGRSNTTGNLNTLVGWVAGQTGNTGTFNGNTFVGAQAGQNTTSGPSTFIGEKAGQANTSGTQNVFLGNSAGLANTIGAQNTILGYTANLSSGILNNATAIGFAAIVDANNKVRIGNTAVTVIEGQVAFTNGSDRRLKTNIRPIENGLDLIMKMKPMSYNMKNSSDTRTNWGFIAQDMQEVAGPDNAIVTVSNNEDKTLGLRYSDIIAPLVKAVQEQQDQIDQLTAEIERLKKAVGLKAENK